jgi:hypothetical protein
MSMELMMATLMLRTRFVRCARLIVLVMLVDVALGMLFTRFNRSVNVKLTPVTSVNTMTREPVRVPTMLTLLDLTRVRSLEFETVSVMLWLIPLGMFTIGFWVG